MSLRMTLLLWGSVLPTPHIEKMIFSSAMAAAFGSGKIVIFPVSDKAGSAFDAFRVEKYCLKLLQLLP